MKIFHLQHNKYGRVMLDEELVKGNEVIRTIQAKDWGDARATIEHYEFEERDGYGFFTS